MPAPSPGYVKNMIRRSLREILDPSPTKSQVKTIWIHFDSKCVYCGKELDRSKKEGHIDHLVPASQGGSNHISNRVLSCAICNEKEKLDSPWNEFLDRKAPDPTVRRSRRSAIQKWQQFHGGPDQRLDSETLLSLETASYEAVQAYDRIVDRMRNVDQAAKRGSKT